MPACLRLSFIFNYFIPEKGGLVGADVWEIPGTGHRSFVWSLSLSSSSIIVHRINGMHAGN
jgi:hypothetical protein